MTFKKLPLYFVLFFVFLNLGLHLWGYLAPSPYDKNSEYSGIITQISLTEKGTPVLKIKNFRNEVIVYYGSGADIIVGDSIVKKKGEQKLNHYRNGELINVFE